MFLKITFLTTQHDAIPLFVYLEFHNEQRNSILKWFLPQCLVFTLFPQKQLEFILQLELNLNRKETKVKLEFNLNSSWTLVSLRFNLSSSLMKDSFWIQFDSRWHVLCCWALPFIIVVKQEQVIIQHPTGVNKVARRLPRKITQNWHFPDWIGEETKNTEKNNWEKKKNDWKLRRLNPWHRGKKKTP